MTEWIEVNGAKIEKHFLEENVAEAKTYQWDKSPWNAEYGDHVHCMICTKVLPDKPMLPELQYYKSAYGWLCSYCYNRFLGKGDERVSGLHS